MRPPIIERSTLIFAAALALVMLALLIGPRIPDSKQAEHCVVNVNLPGPFGLSLNCDSPEFMRLASKPAHLFDPANERQSRPGLIVAAAILTAPLLPLSRLPEWLGVAAQRGDIDPLRISNALASYPPAFIAYILLNVALLIAAFYFFRRTAALADVPDAEVGFALVAVGLLLVANDIVKVFAWSPHTQMFNVLVPVLGVYIALRAGAPEAPSRRFALAIGFMTGLGVTAYALFAVLVPCFVLPLLLRALMGPRAALKTRLVDAVLFCVMAGAPFAAWYGLVHAVTGSFYQHEIATGQVRWMHDAYVENGGAGVLARLWEHLRTLSVMAAGQGWALAAMAFWLLLVVSMYSKWRALEAIPKVVAAGFFVSVLVAGFYASTGLTIERLAYPMLPPLIVVLGVTAAALAARLRPGQRRLLVIGCLAISVTQLSEMLLKFPPRW